MEIDSSINGRREKMEIDSPISTIVNVQLMVEEKRFTDFNNRQC